MSNCPQISNQLIVNCYKRYQKFWCAISYKVSNQSDKIAYQMAALLREYEMLILANAVFL